MKLKTQSLLLLGCLAICVTGCQQPAREAAVDFKTRIEASLQATNSVETAAVVEEMHHYMQNMKIKDHDTFFSAWPNGSDGCKAWMAEVAVKMLEMIDDEE